MALTTILNLETHGAGTVGLNGIIDGNWARLETIFGPTLVSTDDAYEAFWRAVVRDATDPTTESAKLEWDITTGKPHFHPGYFVATHATSYTASFADGKIQKLDITGTTNFQSLSGQNAGQELEIIIICDGSTRNLSFPAGWVFVGAAAPANIAANKTAVLVLRAMGTNDSDVVARYVVEP